MKFNEYLKLREQKKETPRQGKGANPYMNQKPDGKLRVAKDDGKDKSLGELGGSNIKPSDSSLGLAGGEGGVSTTNEAKSPYPKGKADGRIRKVKDKEKSSEWGNMRTPGIDPSTSSLGKEPEKGVGTTTENQSNTEKFLDETKDMSMIEFMDFMVKKKVDEYHECPLDDDFTDDFSGEKVYVPLVKVLTRAAKAMVRNPKAPKIFVRELKRLDSGIPVFMEEMMSHPETYCELASCIGNNENKSARKLVKELNQHYLDYLNELGMFDESASPPMSRRLSDPATSSDEPNAGEMPAEPMSDQLQHSGSMGMGVPGGGGMAGAPTLPGEESGGGPFGGGGSALGGAPFAPTGQSPEGVGGNPPGEMQGGMVPSEGKQFGYHHLIKEMGGYGNMKNAMKEYLEL